MAPSKRGKRESSDWVVLELPEVALKKEAWRLKVCERLAPARAVEEMESAIDVATLEAFAQEVEKLRLSLGLHWTWFQEELSAGVYDVQLGGSEILPPLLEPQGLEHLAKSYKSRRSPASTRSSSTIQTSPASAPQSPPMQAEKRLSIPQEVWLKAEQRRKANAFGAMWPATRAMRQLLSALELPEVLDLLMAGPKVKQAVEEQLPHLGPSEPVPFAGDEAFRSLTWARQRRFLRRLCVGRAEVASVVPLVPQLGSGATLGPFLPLAAPVERLVVSEQQTTRVLDVARRKREEVEIDRYGSKRLLLSSLGLHPREVTTSWPMDEAPSCCVAGGMVAARPSKGAPCNTALQWLELPDHSRERDEARRSLPQEQLAKTLEVSDPVIEAMWALPENQVLLLVRDRAGAKAVKTAKACENWWIQVWSLDAQELRPMAKRQSGKVLTAVAAGAGHLLCGSEEHSELLDLELSRVQRWEVGASQVLWREEVAVLAQEHAVFLASEKLERLLPREGFQEPLALVALRAVGRRGFAVCSRQHVFAFEAVSAQRRASLSCVVELPGARQEVEHFFASPYEFFVVLGTERKRRGLCCLWPSSSSASARGAYGVPLKAWRGGGEVVEAEAVDLRHLVQGAELTALCYDRQLLAVSAPGRGVAVVAWGTEVSGAVEALRQRRQALLALEEEEKRLELLRRQLSRLQQRLQETEKLEEKAAKGALSSEEQSKVARKPQMEADIERLVNELGLAGHHSEEEALAEEDPEAVLASKRRAKERVQRQHHEEKRAMQKERQKCRDRKFS